MDISDVRCFAWCCICLRLVSWLSKKVVFFYRIELKHALTVDKDQTFTSPQKLAEEKANDEK